MINTSELISTHQLTQRHERFTSRRQRGGRAVTVYSHSSTGCWGRKTTEPSTFSRVQCSDQNRAEGINPVCCRVRVRCQCLSGSQVWCDSDMSCSRVSSIKYRYWVLEYSVTFCLCWTGAGLCGLCGLWTSAPLQHLCARSWNQPPPQGTAGSFYFERLNWTRISLWSDVFIFMFLTFNTAEDSS